MVSSRTPQRLTEQDVWSSLATIQDPEIPVLTLAEMKIIRSVSVEAGKVTVVLAPTFVGCPAIELMKEEIRARLSALGADAVDIILSFSPPWSTDLLEPAVREKLRTFGIAPPPPRGGDLAEALALPVPCPRCGSTETRMQGAFGATLCKHLYICGNCRQPFERFKPV